MNSVQRNIPPLRDIARTFYWHKRIWGGYFIVVMAATLAVIGWYPRRYASQAKLYLRMGRETVSLDPTATTGEIISVQESRKSEINTVVEMLGSRVLHERVVEQLGPSFIVDGTAAATDSSGEIREQAIILFGESLEVYAPKDSYVINVKYLGSSPKQAQRITAELVDAFMVKHLRAHRTSGSQEFFQQQTELMQKEWTEAARRLQDAKNAMGLISIEAQKKLLEEESGRIESELVAATTAHSAATAKVQRLEESIQEMPERVRAQEVQGNPNNALDTMRAKLYELELLERELGSKFTAAHPQVIAVREQVREAREVLASQEPKRTLFTTTVNPNREKLQLELLTQQVEAESLSAKVAALREEYARSQQRVKQLNEREAEMHQLEQEAELAQANYKSYSENLEQTRIDQALQDDRISNVNVFQPASLEMEPVVPNKKMVLVIGLAAAVLGSLVITMLMEQMDYSLRSAEDVERELQLPVLVSLPRTRPTASPLSRN
jgi:uncharacterized protein involved in exopolysaccharide biosynthesis